MDSQWELAVWCRELNMVLCNNLEVWDGMGAWEGGSRGDIRTVMADSCCCMAETNTIL